jgi:hypothetical protein
MKLAPHLTIPPDAVSRTIGILAQKGAGKTYTGMKLAELMLDMLEALADSYPNVMTKAELGEAAGVSHTSGTFGTYLAKLRSLELIHGSSELKASDELFD